jgi:hypothetical protein
MIEPSTTSSLPSAGSKVTLTAPLVNGKSS